MNAISVGSEISLQAERKQKAIAEERWVSVAGLLLVEKRKPVPTAPHPEYESQSKSLSSVVYNQFSHFIVLICDS